MRNRLKPVTKCLIEPVPTGYMLTFTREHEDGGASAWTVTVRSLRAVMDWLNRELL